MKTIRFQKLCVKSNSRISLLKFSALFLFIITISVLKVNAQCTCTGNLVTNPSFESGTTGWTSSGGNFNAGTGAVKCGSFSGDFEITNTSSNSVYQVVGTDLAIGTVINANVWSGTHNNSFSHKVFIHFYNASNVFMSTGSVEVEVDKVLANSPAGPQLYTFSATVPSGAKFTRVGFKGTGNWVKTDMWCVTTATSSCNAKVNSLYFNKLDGGADLPITNGSTFTVAQLGSLYNLEAVTTGTVGSVKFTITGPTATSNIENTAPYNSPATGSGAWTGVAGNYSVNLKTYSASGATGTLCHDTTITFILNSTLTLGNKVWYDANNNGLNDASENGIRNISVKLYADANNDNVADGAAIATTTSNSSGNYSFTNLSSGNYIVGVIVPNGYMSSSVNGGDPDNNTDLDDNGQVSSGNEIRGLAITLASGTEPGGSTNNTYDFGLLPDCACVNSAGNLLVNGSFENGTTGWSWSNGTLTTGTGYIACGTKNGFNNWSSGTAKVWQDVNVSTGSVVTFKAFAGTHTAGITCSPKLSLIFLNAANTVLGQTDVTVTRDVDINFGQLEQYSITAIAPAGTTKARVQSSITCNTMKIDAFCLTATPGCNVNAGTDGSTSVCDNSTTAIDLYSIITGEQSGGTWSRLTGTGGTFVAASGTFTPAAGASTSTFRYVVTGTAPCSNDTSVATVNILPQANAGADGSTSVCDTTTTAINLYNLITGEQAGGTWTRLTGTGGTFNAAAGTFTPAIGATNSTFQYSVGGAPCSPDLSVATVTIQQCQLLTLGNKVWYDANNNGLNDATENGIRNISVKLYADANNDNVADGAAIATTTTNSSGNYSFTNLSAGNYIVGVIIPNGYMSSSINGGDPDNNIDLDDNGQVSSGNEIRGLAITLASGTEPGGNTNNTYDFGLLPDCSCVNSTGNLLVNPSFENGTTGWSWSNGTLTTGTGYIACGLKNGFNSWSSGTSKVWQDVAVVAGSVVNFKGFAGTHTGGLTCSPKLSLIFLNASNTVLGQSDVTVTKDVTINFGQLDEYSITAIAPVGSTKVRVQSSITCNTMKLDAFCLTTATPDCIGQNSPLLHFPSCPDIPWPFGPGVIASANTIFEIIPYAGGNYARFTIVNTSQNLPTCGETTGPDALSFNLSQSLSTANITVVSPSTFKELRIGSTPGCNSPFGQFSYEVRRNEHNNINFVFEVKIPGVNLTSADFVVNSLGHRFLSRINGICYNNVAETRAFSSCASPASLGDLVWEDFNRDGLQDAGEPGIPGATVVLKDNNGNTVGTTTTNASGLYSFTNLIPGTYSVTFTTPTNYIPTLSNIGGDDTKDSDPVAGVAGGIVLIAGQNDITVDAGFYKLINLSGNVWHDANALLDNEVNSTSPLAIPTGLRVYMVNGNTGLIERSVLVNPSTGTFNFNNINPLTTYRLYLSSVSYPIGTPESVFLLVPVIPGGWEHTGQKNANPPNSPFGSDGINDGKITVPVGVNSVININFGIRISGGDVVQG